MALFLAFVVFVASCTCGVRGVMHVWSWRHARVSNAHKCNTYPCLFALDVSYVPHGMHAENSPDVAADMRRSLLECVDDSSAHLFRTGTEEDYLDLQAELLNTGPASTAQGTFALSSMQYVLLYFRKY